MVDIGKLKPAWFDHRTDIPQWICNRIAYAVVEWAVLERELEELIRILMDGEIQQVRILVNNMNARTRVQTAANLIQALMVLKKLKRRDRTRLNNLGKKIETAQNNRDMLARSLEQARGEMACLAAQTKPTNSTIASLHRTSVAIRLTAARTNNL
jgi:CII-binding regulator of phage lambda lysogenization HflD